MGVYTIVIINYKNILCDVLNLIIKLKQDKMKQELIEHLKTRGITDIHHLWAESKNYYDDKSIVMGGGYCSWRYYIRVTLNINGKLERFEVKIEDCN